MAEIDAALSRRALIGGSLLGLSACSGVQTGYAYRLIIEVNIAGRGQIYEGVRRVARRDVSAFPNGRLLHTDVSGDALGLSMRHGRSLFVLMVTSDGSGDYWLPDPFLTVAGDPYSLTPRTGPEIEVPISALPMMVTFSDSENGDTGVLVRPEDIGSVFGAETRLVRAAVALTARPVTRGIEEQLPWLRKKLREPRAFSSTISELGRFYPNPEWFKV